jgi:chitinase
MTSNNFDGLDLAWQFPNSGEDMFNYSLLLGDILLAINGYGTDTIFGLTATLPCNDRMEHIDIRALGSVLTGFNLISFNFQGPWGGVVGANSPLYDPTDRAGQSVSGCVAKYMEGGVSRNQINIGLPFYGHSYVGAKTIGDRCKADWAGVCTDTNTWHEDGGSPQFHNIYRQMPDMALTYDSQTATSLASNDQGVVSFDNPRSICLKTEYAMSNAGGVVIFDLTSDMLIDRSTPLLDAVNLKILQPDINCDGEDFEKLFAWRDVDQYEIAEPTQEIAELSHENAEPTHEITVPT